jgi:hypothetical protein
MIITALESHAFRMVAKCPGVFLSEKQSYVIASVVVMAEQASLMTCIGFTVTAGVVS